MTRTRSSTRAVSTLTVKISSVCAAMLLSACANMSGLGGSADYGCKAPQGVQCNSVSGNYYNAIANNLPSQRQHRPAAGSNGSASAPASALAPVSSTSAAAPIAGKAGAALPLPVLIPVPLAASPLRSQARVLRLWFKPWEDADHDLYDQGYVYVQIDSGRWLIDHAQQRIRDAYAPVRPPQPQPRSLSAAVPAVPAAPAASSTTTSPRLSGAGAADNNTSPSVSKPFPGAVDLPADDSQ